MSPVVSLAILAGRFSHKQLAMAALHLTSFSDPLRTMRPAKPLLSPWFKPLILSPHPSVFLLAAGGFVWNGALNKALFESGIEITLPEARSMFQAKRLHDLRN